MLLDTPAVERLVDALRTLPGVGKRSAERIALHLLSAPEGVAYTLSDALRDARGRISRCSVCRNLTDQDPCRICSDDRRDPALVCVVEQPAGAMAIERGGAFRGRYHVLHGVINPLDGVGPRELAIDDLVERVEREAVREVIIATNATVEGESTALYLHRRLEPLGIPVTRIAHGVPMGGGLEYADDATLSHALEGRTRIG